MAGLTARDLLRTGDLGAALEALQAEVRKDPSEAKHRIFLFQLLCATGDWNRALTQLRLCAQLDPAAMAMAQTYREAIGCEFVRARVFAAETAPLVFGQPQQWIALLVEALGADARGDAGAAASLRAQAFEAAAATAGAVNGRRFAWIADADMRLGPVLEMVMNGRYYWAPFNTIRRIAVEEPTDLRDRVWTPAMVTWANGGEVAALIPTRYPGIGAGTPDALRLARATDWTEVAPGSFTGAGQRVLATDIDDFALMDIRQLVLEMGETGESAPAGAAAEPGDV